LSGLGFGKQAEKAEEKIDLDEFFGKNEPVTTSKVDIFDVASRNVNERREQARKEGKPSRRENTAPVAHSAHTPAHNPAYRGKPKRPGGNVSIEQGVYVAKEKSVSSSDIFDAARAKSTQSSTGAPRPPQG
jgi:hypothetical protein